MNRICHILGANCLLEHGVEGKIVGTRKRGKRPNLLLDELEDCRRYWNTKEEALARILCKTRFRKRGRVSDSLRAGL